MRSMCRSPRELAFFRTPRPSRAGQGVRHAAFSSEHQPQSPPWSAAAPRPKAAFWSASRATVTVGFSPARVGDQDATWGMTLALFVFQHYAVVKWMKVHEVYPPFKSAAIPPVPATQVLKIRFLEACVGLSTGRTGSEMSNGNDYAYA